MIRAVAPGRVNLIGDHTDYTGGMVFPMAINRFTTIDFAPSDESVIELLSQDDESAAIIQLPVTESQISAIGWGRYIAAVAKECGATRGIKGNITTTIPIGSGLSSSAALEVATALALVTQDQHSNSRCLPSALNTSPLECRLGLWINCASPRRANSMRC